ncbi:MULTISPECIES: hypothetical protein [Bizionia]|uniref:DUF1735 domain-containing protein n=1 Tax=Bizionia algoritergicola TaxID=291187 RepID=A0A5D0QNZ0_9FLAO|nr:MULTISPECIES: hypothetical protein [Bizionia]OBX22360.1 hypothetical protein BAA08_08850 [Bizionia sp. APA-3]TYB70575.1 hypothetical protein ES675_15500 [Bizionia algoritergicola]
MKNLKIYFTAVFASVICFSCIVDDEVENATQNEDLSRIIGFKEDVTLGNFVQSAGTTFDFGVPVHLLGGNNGLAFDSEITVTYEIGDIQDLNLSASEYASTFNLTKDQRLAIEGGTATIYDFAVEAQEGVHFDLVDTTLESTIPANSTFDLIDTKVYNDELNASKISFYVLNLKAITTSGDVVIGEQLITTIVKLQLCRTDLAGTYTASGNTSGSFTITSLGGGDYQLSSMFGWPTSGYTSFFYACAGQLVFTSWPYSNEIIQGVPGYVNGSGQIVFEQFGIENVYSGWTVILTAQ